MTQLAQHVHDPVVWLRLTQVAGFIALSVLMLMEPMTCGGKNRVFHRLLAFLFAVEAFGSFRLAQTRCELLQSNPACFPTTVNLLLSETFVVVAIIAVLGNMAYQLYRWRAYNAIKRQPPSGEACPRHFEP